MKTFVGFSQQQCLIYVRLEIYKIPVNPFVRLETREI